MAKKRPFIVSSWKGIDYIKSRHSGRFRLSKGSKQSATMLQAASPVAKQFRQMFMPLLPFPADRVMQTTFVGAFMKWMKYKSESSPIAAGDIPYISHFQFNRYSSLHDRLHIPLQVCVQQPSGLLLEIPAIVPALHIGAPAYTSHVAWKIMAASCALKNPAAVDCCSLDLNMSYNTTPIPAQSITLPLIIPSNSMSLVTIAFQYTKNKDGVISVSKDKRWLPCGVAGGWVME